MVQLGSQESLSLFSATRETVAENRVGRDGSVQATTLVRKASSGGRLPGSPLSSASCQLGALGLVTQPPYASVFSAVKWDDNHRMVVRNQMKSLIYSVNNI